MSRFAQAVTAGLVGFACLASVAPSAASAVEPDTQAPGPVTNLTLSADAPYRLTATWTRPTDPDLAGVAVELVDPATDTVRPCPSFSSPTSCTWSAVPGGVERLVRATAHDTSGNVSPTVEALGTSLPDSNGTPGPVPLADVLVMASGTDVSVRVPRPTISDFAQGTWILRAAGTQEPLAQGSFSTGVSYLTASFVLPDAGATYDIAVGIVDLNGNVGTTLVPGVVAGPPPGSLPPVPADVRLLVNGDNSLEVTWPNGESQVNAKTWTVTLIPDDPSSAPIVRTVPSAALFDQRQHEWFHLMPGGTSWRAKVVSGNEYGMSPAVYTGAVVVPDTTAPAPVTSPTLVSAYDRTQLGWTLPADFDLDRIEVVRVGVTVPEWVTVYSGVGTSTTLTGLVAGRTYRFELRSYDPLGNVGVPVVVTTNQALATLSAVGTLRYGSTTSLTGVLTATGKPLAGVATSLFAQKVGSTAWTRVGGATTTATGAFALTVKPTVNTRYRVGYAGSGATGGAYSPTRTVTVTPATTVRASRTSLYLGGSVTLSTTVAPNHAGRAISLQRWNGRSWVTLTRRTLSSTSTASITTKPTVRGYNSYRWYLPAHTDHGTGVTSTVKVRVY